MKPNIRSIISLSNKLRQSLGAVDTPRPGLSQNQYDSTINRLGEAADWGRGRDAVRRAGNQLPGASDDQIDGILAAIRASLNRLSKSNPADGANWKSSRAGFEDAISSAETRAVAARQGAKEVGDADAITANLLAKIKETMPKATSNDDLEGLAEAFSNLGDTPVFDQLVKEGLVQAFSERSVSSLLKGFAKAGKVSDLDAITSRFSSSQLRNILNSNPEQIAAIRTAAVDARVRLLKKAYADAGRLAGKDSNAARTRLAQIDSYIQRRMTEQFRMFDDAQRNALVAARTSAVGKISTSPMLTAQPGAAAPGATRRTVAPRSADADPLARP
jgi:hypothetical protein